jgi:hypothetical protein
LHVPRSGSSRFLARTCAGVAIVVALLGASAMAQAPAPPLGPLRPSIEDGSDQPGPPGQPGRPRATRDPSRIGQIPSYGNPPASGAGTTGFDSTNRRRRAGTPPPVAQSAPQSILAPAAIPLPPSATRGSRPGLPLLPAFPRRPEPTGVNPPPATPTSLTDQPPSGASPPAATSLVSGALVSRTPATPGIPPAPAANPLAGPPPPVPVTSTPTAATTAGVTAAVTNTSPTGATLPLAQRMRKPVAEEDPYDATGIRVENLLLRPAIEATTGYDTNPSRLPGGAGSLLYMISPELIVRSDWERHQLNADIRGSYSAYPADGFANRPNLDSKINGRIDVNRDTDINLEGRYLLSTDYPGSPNVPVGVANLPVFQRPGATVGVTERFGRLEISLKGLADRTMFNDSILLDGSTSSNKDRDYDQFGGVLRGSYELTPGIKPFAEIGADTRVHDLAVDRSGNMRDSDGITPRVGTTFELSRKLTGEVSIGYVTRTFKDPTLPDIRGLIVDGSLVWTATGLTSVKLTAKSSEDESVLPGVSGLLRRDAGLEVDHAFRRWLIGTVKLGFGLDDYVGATRVDHRYSASAGIAYKLTRSVQIKGELRQEWLRSNTPGVDYTATVALIGIRLQR